MKTMVADVFTVMVVEGDRLLASRYNVSGKDLASEVDRLAAAHPGKQLLVNGIDYTHLGRHVPQTNLVPGPQPVPAPAPRAAAMPISARGQPLESATMELAHHMLWESYQRAAETQAFLIEKMATATFEHTRRIADQSDALQQRYQAAMLRVDHMAWEQKMIEAETSTRRLSDHHRRIADDDRRARQPSLIEQVAAGCVKIIEALGSDSIDSDG